MKENKDQLEQIIKSEYDRIAQNEETDIQCDGDICVPEGIQDMIRERLDNQIEELEREKTYSRLSEEDRKALELGRKMLAEEKKEEDTVRVVRKRKPLKFYIGLVAVLVIVLGVGMTSMGGPERVIEMMKRVVGSREVVQVDSSETNKIIAEENEEEAYQTISEEFGIEPVKIIYKVDKMKFEKMELDEEIQTAELIYKYDKETIVYIVNASYRDTSWGIDVEDKNVESTIENIRGCDMNIKEYRTETTNTERYSARFRYNGLEYFLIGTMEKEEFYSILNNLFF